MTKTYSHTLQADEHPVKSVTIFKSSTAEVVRTFAVDLQAGENHIEIKGLSSVIDTESARVSGLGDGVRLFDIVCNIKKPLHAEDDHPLEETRRLELQLQEFRTENKIREHEANILINYGKTLKGDHVSPESANGFLQIFLNNGKENMKAATRPSEEIIRIERQIARQREKLSERNGSANGRVAITLSATRVGPVQLNLTYIVQHASWKPLYDLHASTEEGRPSSAVNLQYRARITQKTGEDWTDASLTLSTSTSDASGTSVPTLQSLQVSQLAPPRSPRHYGTRDDGVSWHRLAREPSPAYDQSRHRHARSRSPTRSRTSTHLHIARSVTPPQPAYFSQPPVIIQPPSGPSAPYSGGWFGGLSPERDHFSAASELILEAEMASLASETEGVELVEPGPLEESATIVNESPLSTAYTVEEKSTIPSDGISHQVLVASLPFEAEMTYVAVPRVETIAYLQCKVKNTSDYRLLPGTVSVFLDDSFVSKTTIHDVNAGDTFQCTLGADPSIRLTFARTSSTGAIEGGAFAEQSKTTTYKAVTTVRNKHRFALEHLLVRDSIPLVPPEDKRTRVMLRNPIGLADAEASAEVEVEDAIVRWFKDDEGKTHEKEGKIEWEAKVESGGEVTLKLEYDIRGPAESKWTLRAA